MLPISQLPDLTPLGRLIAHERKKAKLSQLDAANRIGISRTYLSQIENGVALNLSYRLVKTIVDLFGINLHTWLPPENFDVTKPHRYMGPPIHRDRTIGRMN